MTPLPAGCTLANLRRGNGGRSHWIYAEVRGPDGSVLIQATLEYCVRRMVDSLPVVMTPSSRVTP